MPPLTTPFSGAYGRTRWEFGNRRRNEYNRYNYDVTDGERLVTTMEFRPFSKCHFEVGEHGFNLIQPTILSSGFELQCGGKSVCDVTVQCKWFIVETGYQLATAGLRLRLHTQVWPWHPRRLFSQASAQEEEVGTIGPKWSADFADVVPIPIRILAIALCVPGGGSWN